MLSAPFRLQPEHLTACQDLSIEAGWNQNKADWRFLLEHGFVIGIGRGERLVATAGVMPYGERFGWICMVLVTAAERRNGLASRLMQTCMDWLASRGAIAGLDATLAGREVYRRLGFRDVYPVTRFHRPRQAPRVESAASAEPDRLLQSHDMAHDMADVASFDRAAFGENRLALLSEWRRRMPDMGLCVSVSGEIAGYILAREGLAAAHIGPLVARDADIAAMLLRTALERVSGPVFMDVPDRHEALTTLLLSEGFATQRTFTRMLLGRSEPLDRPERIFALTGAEFG